MAQRRARDNDQLPVFKLDGRRNKMEFIRGFRRVAEHYHITEIVYDNVYQDRLTGTIWRSAERRGMS